MKIESLFPVPIAIFDLGIKLCKEEYYFIVNQQRRLNSGNETSVDNYILKKLEMRRVSNAIQLVLEKYVKDVWKADIEPYVTQSWVNWTKPGQYHHTHSHPNSLYSGVFYVDVHNKRDGITFSKINSPQFKLKYIENNCWNSDHWWIPVETNKVILFPSNLTHMVEQVPTKNTYKERISLSFNTFAKQIGDNLSLTELVLIDTKS